MGKVDFFTGDLVDETLKEAADTFFGKRKKIDEELNLFGDQVKKVQRIAEKIKFNLNRLNYLLVDDAGRELFWRALDLDETVYPTIKGQWQKNGTLPNAFTLKGKYLKSVRFLYENLQKSVEDYLHGHYVEHPEVKGKKVMTPNLNNLKKWADEINELIEEVNSSNNPDDVLAFTRRMDVDQCSKRESVGSGLEYNYKDELCFKPLEFSTLDLADYPDLSGGKETYSRIKKASLLIFGEKKEIIKKVINNI
ncbi:MAG: hypothetical protein D5R98_02100 [Desulfonatronovibrio sp. MSAO_Bac4]|nr:MAG: hypothetical protein D5R98_02100 [Desulfonatronovibrio sp. MSAO_Bac4]